MPYYRCNLIDKTGKKTSIIKEASGTQELIVSFNNTEQILIKYTPIDNNVIVSFKKNFKRNIILEFTEIMASLLKSGLTIQDAVALCSTITSSHETIRLAKNLHQALKNGLSLNESMKMHTPSFSPLYQALIRLGEKTGSVTAVFRRMSVYLRNEKQIKNKIGNVIWYPLLVLLISIVGCICIVVFMLPQMTEIYTAFNVDNTSEAGIEIARVYRSIWVSLCLWTIVIAIVVSVIVARKTSERIALITDHAILRMPILGNFIKSIQTMDFSFAMEMLTGSGITVQSALNETSQVVRNRAYSKAIHAVQSSIVQGKILSQSFAAFREFPPYIATWIAIGEQTGAVEAVFTQIREYFQSDVNAMSERLMNMLEPFLVLIVGIVILTMIIQFILPIFTLYGSLL
jgi:type II secretory pathway component PulF